MKYYVYFFLDKDKQPIYIGRTKNLKQRLNAHFSSAKKDDIAKAKEVKSIKYLEFETQFKHIVYEQQLIHLFKPKYNKEYVLQEDSEVILNIDDLFYLKLSEVEFEKLKNKKNRVKKSNLKLNFDEKEFLGFLSNNMNYDISIYNEMELKILGHFFENSNHGYTHSFAKNLKISELVIKTVFDKFIENGIAQKEFVDLSFMKSDVYMIRIGD